MQTNEIDGEGKCESTYKVVHLEETRTRRRLNFI